MILDTCGNDDHGVTVYQNADSFGYLESFTSTRWSTIETFVPVSDDTSCLGGYDNDLGRYERVGIPPFGSVTIFQDGRVVCPTNMGEYCSTTLSWFRGMSSTISDDQGVICDNVTNGCFRHSWSSTTCPPPSDKISVYRPKLSDAEILTISYEGWKEKYHFLPYDTNNAWCLANKAGTIWQKFIIPSHGTAIIHRDGGQDHIALVECPPER